MLTLGLVGKCAIQEIDVSRGDDENQGIDFGRPIAACTMTDRGRDVVVTGMGAVTPFGIGVDALWDGVRNGRSGVDWIESLPDLDPEVYPVRYAAEVKHFAVDEHLKQHCEVRLEKDVQMGLVAAREALSQAQLLDSSDKRIDPSMRIETIVGSGHGPCHEAEIGYSTFFQRGPRHFVRRPFPSPCSIPCRRMYQFILE